MGWKFWKRENPMDPQQLLAQAHAQSPLPKPPHREPQPPGTTAGTGFRMVVEDVFTITGRGTVVTGRVAAGRLGKGQSVTLSRNGEPLRTTVVTAVEQFRKTVEVAAAGDNVGLLLDGVGRADVEAGDVLTA